MASTILLLDLQLGLSKNSELGVIPQVILRGFSPGTNY
jgi:hypothetical protein